jgi:hypothetical protein
MQVNICDMSPCPKKSPPLAVVTFLLLFPNAPLQAQVTATIGQNFTGSVYELNTSSSPADSNGAIGPKHFMEFINGTVAVYNKTNGASVQRKSNLKFWSDAGVIISTDYLVSDPRVIYDPLSQRWFASQVDFNASATDPTLEANDFLLAVSSTSDPTGAWHGFMFQADPDNGSFADFPTLGVDSNAVYLSGDMFMGEENPLGPSLVSIPKADLLLATSTIANRTWHGVMDPAQRGEVLQPAICLDGSATGHVLAVGNIGSDSDPHSNIVSFVVQDAGSTTATLSSSASLTVNPYVVPFNSDMGVPLLNAYQPDGTATLQANDARFSANVYAVGGVLYAVHCTQLNGHVAIRWYCISAATRTLLESGTISDPDLDLIYPSVAANAAGVVVIAYNGSSVNSYISCYAQVGQAVNGVTTFGNRMLLQSGTVSYHDLNEIIAQLLDEPVVDSRWGDYSAVSVDPADPNRFWTIQMFPSDTGSSDEGIWSTQITEIITTPPAPSLRIAVAGSNAEVSWPATATGFNLESNIALNTTNNWTLVAQNFSTNSGRIYFQTPLTNSARFFRLHKL